MLWGFQAPEGGFEVEDDEDFSTAAEAAQQLAEASPEPAAKKRKVEGLVGRTAVKDGGEDDEVMYLPIRSVSELVVGGGRG